MAAGQSIEKKIEKLRSPCTQTISYLNVVAHLDLLFKKCQDIQKNQDSETDLEEVDAFGDGDVYERQKPENVMEKFTKFIRSDDIMQAVKNLYSECEADEKKYFKPFFKHCLRPSKAKEAKSDSEHNSPMTSPSNDYGKLSDHESMNLNPDNLLREKRFEKSFF